jgi:hypothetical protein
VREVLVENAVRGLVDGAKVRTEFDSLNVGRLRTTSIVKGFVDAMMWLLVAMLLKRGVETYRIRGL